MSVIIAIQKDGVVYMGCDTQMTKGKDKVNKTQECTFKISKLKSGMLVGVCGKVGAYQCVTADESVLNVEGDELTKREIVNEMIPKIKKQLTDQKWDTSEDGDMPINMMLAYKDRLYMVNSDYSVMRITDYYASGSGGDYTFATISDESLPIRDRILKGLRISAMKSTGVSRPFVLIDTDKLEYELIEK